MRGNILYAQSLYVISFNRPTAEVTFHFFGNSDDGDKIRESLNRLVQRRRLSEIALESTHFTFQQKPALKLQVIYCNLYKCIDNYIFEYHKSRTKS